MKGDSVPFVQASSAAASSCMHCLENRMTMHGRLLAVVHWIRRSQFLKNKVLRVFSDDVHSFFLKICQFLPCKMEAGAEPGMGQFF